MRCSGSRIRITIAIGVVLSFAACGGLDLGGTPTFVYPPTDEVRANFGQIGVVSEPADRAFQYPVGDLIVGAPAAANYYSKRAMEGCIGFFWKSEPQFPFDRLGGLMLSPLAPVCAMVAMPPAAMLGAAVSNSPEKAAHAKADIDSTISEIALRVFRDHIIDSILRQTGRRPRRLGTVQALSPEEPRVHDIDTFFWIDLTGTLNFGSGKFNPDVSLVLSSTVKLIRRANGSLMYTRTWWYLGPKRTHFSLAENGAKNLRADVEEGFQLLAERIAFEIFVNKEPEIIDPLEEGEKTVRNYPP